MRNLRRILGIKWSDCITNSKVLRRAATAQHWSTLCWTSPSLARTRPPQDAGQYWGYPRTCRRSHWRAHNRQESSGPPLRFKDVCKKDMKALDCLIRRRMGQTDYPGRNRSCWRRELNPVATCAEGKRNYSLRQMKWQPKQTNKNNATCRHHYQSSSAAAAGTAQPQQALLRQCQLIVTDFSRPEQISPGGMATRDRRMPRNTQKCWRITCRLIWVTQTSLIFDEFV